MSYSWWLRSSVLLLLCLTLLVPIVVADGRFFPALLFPYVTGKTITFRIMVELATGLYVLLTFCEPQYRPRMSLLKCAACAFVGWGAIAVFTSVDPSKSFWSNVERMDGYLTLLHLFAYFLIIGSVITMENWWKRFLQISLFASTLMGIYGLLQEIGVLSIAQQNYPRIDGTFGNPTFLAVYLLFGVFIAVLLLAMEPKSYFLRWAYGISLVLQSLALYYTQTRGAFLGLLIGLIIAAAFTAWRARAPELRVLRHASLSVLGLVMVLVGTFLAVRDLPVVRRSATLGRIAAISLEHRTVEPRLRAWGIVWQGFLERPVFGWGQENFNAVINKFYHLPLDELNEWYDRAHNQFLDWLVAGGFPMLALYVSLFVIAGWLFRSSISSVLAQAALLGLLAAYAFNNLLFFDGLVSAMYFWLVLAFADSFSSSGPASLLERPYPMSPSGMTVATSLVAVVAFTGMWMLNAPGYMRAQELLSALSIETQENVVKCSRAAILASC